MSGTQKIENPGTSDTNHLALSPYKVIKDWPGDKNSSDPNYHYRDWLEEYVGEQGIDWDWYINPRAFNEIVTCFRKSEDAALFRLRF